MDVNIGYEDNSVYIGLKAIPPGTEVVRTTYLAKHGLFLHWNPPGVLAGIEIHGDGPIRLYELNVWDVQKNVCGFCMEDIHGTMMAIAGSPEPPTVVWTHVASGHERCTGRDSLATPANLRAP